MKKTIHDTLILAVLTLVLGLVLGAVYNITKDPIAAAEAETRQAAFKEVFDDADSFEELEGFDSGKATAFVTGKGFKDSIDDIVTAKAASGEKLGYIITVTAKDGSQGTITFSVGIRNDGTVNGYSVTDIAETPGLGMKATEDDFVSQFRDKLVTVFNVVKQAPASDDEIEAISGATITSKAVANGVNAVVAYFGEFLMGGE